jgi:hypothetical protein
VKAALSLIAALAAAPAVAETTPETTLDTCKGDLALALSVLAPGEDPGQVPSRVEKDGWCVIFPPEGAPLAWRHPGDDGGHGLELRYPAPGAGGGSEIEIAFEARYDAATGSVDVTDLHLLRGRDVQYRLVGRIDGIALDTPETLRDSLERMTLSAATLTVTGDAPAMARVVQALFRFDAAAARADPSAARTQREAMIVGFENGPLRAAFDLPASEAVTAFARDYPDRGGEWVLGIPETSAFPLALVYRYLLFSEVPVLAGVMTEMRGWHLSLDWRAGA